MKAELMEIGKEDEPKTLVLILKEVEVAGTQGDIMILGNEDAGYTPAYAVSWHPVLQGNPTMEYFALLWEAFREEGAPVEKLESLPWMNGGSAVYYAESQERSSG
jgi:hypothetical protein